MSNVTGDAAETYGRAFFDKQAEPSYRSAMAVVPIVLDMVTCSSVVDVGCGVGPWLRAVRERGINDYLGIDGDHLPTEQLVIPPDRFLAHDLRRPLAMDRRFDLAICVEVAEHLPADAATILVDTLTSLSPIVLFSAAVPEQGGDGHINEQWPAYWGRLFWDRGYATYDCLRQRLWNDDRVDWWYRQNMLLIVDRSVHLSDLGPALRDPLPLIHPAMVTAILTRPSAVDPVSAAASAEVAVVQREPVTTDPATNGPRWRKMLQVAGTGLHRAARHLAGKPGGRSPRW